MDYESVDSINTRLAKMTSNGISKIDAIGNNRVETITTGSSIINLLMQKLGFGKVVVSARGLREGILSAFIESPKAYYSENMRQDRIQRSVIVCCRQEITVRQSTHDFIKPLTSIGLIKKREYEILVYAIKQMSKIPPTTNLHNLFYMIIDQDIANLSHSEQLVLALSIIHTKKPKTANWLFKRYDSILQSQNRRSIEKISACISFLEIVERNNSIVKLSARTKNKIHLSIIPGKKNTIPMIHLENILKNLGTVFDIFVDYSISANSYGKTTTNSAASKKINSNTGIAITR
jgi:exopolyphosphatase/guanosine-5'-triphosphate,3'-diphosphate pyrophosphatase